MLHNVYNMWQEVSPYDDFWAYSWMNPLSYAKCESYKTMEIIRTHANLKQGLRNIELSRAMQHWQSWISTFYNYGLTVTTKVGSSQSIVATKYLNSSCTLNEFNMERDTWWVAIEYICYKTVQVPRCSYSKQNLVK